jgi:hypothetical protein
MKILHIFIKIAIAISLAGLFSCSKSHAIACPSYWNEVGGDTRGTPLEKGADGKVAPEGANVKKSGNGIVRKKKDKKMNANYYRGKKKTN